MVILAFTVFCDLENHRVEPPAHPPNRPVLVRLIRTGIQIVRMRPYLLSFFEANSALWVLTQFVALLWVESEAHMGMI